MATRIVKHVDIVDTLVKYIFSLARGKWPDPPHTLLSSLQLTKILFFVFAFLQNVDPVTSNKMTFIERRIHILCARVCHRGQTSSSMHNFI